jgi:hypothetical protein
MQVKKQRDELDYHVVTQSAGHCLDYSDGNTEPGALDMPPI